MKQIQATIKGVAPLLQHRFAEEEHGANNSKKKSKVYVPEDEAKKCLYENKEIGIYEPSEHIYAAVVRAGTKFKFDKRATFKEVLKAGVIVEPECIKLETPNGYTIDARPVVVQRSRIMRWRPRFEEWKLSFTISIIDDDNISPSTLKEILEVAGCSGIGDYRPRFGRFQVIEWRES
jgi:hypothetical protein